MKWDRAAVEKFLGMTALVRIGVQEEFIFTLPFPLREIDFAINPTEDRCMLRTSGKGDTTDEDELLCASIHCTDIRVSDEPKEEGGNCLVLIGGGGHACISPPKGNLSYWQFFFSMRKA
jgi:hypothetical protein